MRPPSAVRTALKDWSTNPVCLDAVTRPETGDIGTADSLPCDPKGKLGRACKTLLVRERSTGAERRRGQIVTRKLGGLVALLTTLGVGSTALAHDFDHPAPSGSAPAPLSSNLNAGGDDAEWELVATIPTGNPQTDLDFFTRGGVTYASAGSLAVGPNSAGQNIIRLTDDGGLVDPSYSGGHPSATCVSDPVVATGLQHDAEAAPKGKALAHMPNPYIVQTDTQVVLDATDGPGRCHDQGLLGNFLVAPQGGLEIIDVTNPGEPKELALTSHVGEAHTVNVDPKRPHIAYVSSSDSMNLNDDGERPNETDGSNTFDGIEVVDFSSCLDLGTMTLGQKRTACKPEVYRYRWQNANVSRSHTYAGTGACHELEIYPDDKIVCAGLMATPVFDMKGAFNDNGTPTDFSDDKPKGTPLPCAVRDSTTEATPFTTGAKVTDCVDGEADADPATEPLDVEGWIALGSPSLEGVVHLGTFHHMGFEDQVGQNFEPAYPATEDIFVAHEAELSQSGRYVFVTDERGGGILPVGATCAPGADNELGNGGIHAFRVDRLSTGFPSEPGDPVKAYQEKVYAKDSEGNRAIYRAPINTRPQGAVCTSHVFQQIPGQNRIFMAWYSQGTQVVDFTENADGTVDFKTAGYFIPENANEWVSHIFKVQENEDGSFTYWGAAADFALADGGRNAIDIYKVTLPAPPKPRFDTPPAGAPPGSAGPPNSQGVAPGTPTFPVSEERGQEIGAPTPACARASGFDAVAAKPVRKRRRVRFSFARTTDRPVRVQVFRHSKGRRVFTKRVANFRNRTKAVTWAAKKAGDGYYQVRFTTIAPNQRRDTRQLGLRRKSGRFRLTGTFDRRQSCTLLQYFGVSRPVFGGTTREGLKVVFRLRNTATVAIEVRRGNKVVKRFKAKSYPRKRRHTLRLRVGGKAKRGVYEFRLKADRPGEANEKVLYSRKL